MIPGLSNLSIDAISFWIGVLVASVFWLMIGWVRPLFKQIRENLKKTRETRSKRGSSSIEEYYRQTVLKQAQGMHLAAPLFSLEEIVVSPSIIAPPPHIEPGDNLVALNQTDLTVPYLSQDPTLASFYQTSTLTIPEALAGGSHLAIVGNPGVGKTVALAFIASLAAKRDPQMGSLDDAVPFLLHVADLAIPEKDTTSVLDPIIDFIAEGASLFNAPRLPGFIRQSFGSGRALLLLDGLDEIPPDEISKVVAFITEIIKNYPNIRVITTGALEFLDGLTQHDFAILPLKTWNASQQNEFLTKWGHLWEKYVAREAWVQAGPEQVDPTLLNSWLSIESTSFTPLELTLKAWGAYAGDGRGPTALDAIETHLRRISPAGTPVAALEMLAMQVSLTAQPIFDSRKARSWIKSFEPPEEKLAEKENEDKKKGKKEKVTPTLGLLSKMAQSGLLSSHLDNKMRFAHPIFGGFLAGRGHSNFTVDERITAQPFWSGKTLFMHYLAANGDATDLVNTLLETPDPILERNLILMGDWLRDAPRKTPWRGKVMTALAAALQDDNLPLGLRGQIVASLARSGDPSVAALFRQLLQSQSSYVIQIVALGSGLMQDKKAIQALANIFQITQNTYTRSAACLALSGIGTDTALEEIATALMQGDEYLRRAAAESLANHPVEGWPILKEGLEIDDLLVRRSVVYGLGRIPETWAKDLLTQVQVEDQEWAVRDIASGILEKQQGKNPHIPRKLSPPSETPWLIAFAGKEGMGISPNTPATDILLLALKSEDIDEQLAALSYLRRTPSEGVINGLYHAMRGGNIELREAVFLALVEIAASGITLPDPQVYGLG
ncbi:MAG: HEAT repeat domain-containing protein [Anaerolineae bacterium]|nr:HEAT repeat domain-containing protein [Anaerolineae bacterium]